MNNYHYHYVVFNAYDNKHSINRDGYYYICAEDLLRDSSIQLVTLPLENCPKWIRLIFDIHNSAKIEKYIRLPFRQLWYPYYFRDTYTGEKPYCFIVLNQYLPVDYLKFLKQRYPTCRIVLLHRDLLNVSKRMNKDMSMNPYLDLEMTFDKGEAIRYGFSHFNEFESKVEITKESIMESDVFFAGNSKGRLAQLLEAYEIFSKCDLKCKYYLTGVPENERVQKKGIEYADKQMSYKEMLYHTVNTRCVLEFNQANCDGFTSRFLEAIIYGKRLITNNSVIHSSKFYAPDKIQVIGNACDINPLFVKEGPDFVDYNYQDDFSPFKMLEKVEEELNKKYVD